MGGQAADGGAKENDGEEGQANDGRGPADGSAPVPLVDGHGLSRSDIWHSAASLSRFRERGAIRDKFKNVQSTYALWEDINEELKPILAKHGFALSFRIPRGANGVEVEGVLSHKEGHRETTSILLPADTTGSKNAVQAVASSVSYGKRYTAGALLNFTTTGEDDDGQTANQKPAAPAEPVITAGQAAQLDALLKKCSQVLQDNFAAKYGCATNVFKSEFDAVSARITKAASRPQE